jgi:predicted RNA polymerase sigma factor
MTGSPVVELNRAVAVGALEAEAKPEPDAEAADHGPEPA